MKYDVVRIAGGIKSMTEVDAETSVKAALEVARGVLIQQAANKTQTFFAEYATSDDLRLGNDPVAVIAVNTPSS